MMVITNFLLSVRRRTEPASVLPAQDMIEYAVLVGLVAILAALVLFGHEILVFSFDLFEKTILWLAST